MMDRINSFPPIIDEYSQILILGSIPGIVSLQKQQYYAHPQNHFWKMIFTLVEVENVQNIDYTKKIGILKKYHIALWDVIESYERKGSGDAHIENEENNDVCRLLIKYPSIKAIFCNGQKAYKNLQRHLGNSFMEIPIVLLPSTSPLHTIPFELKLEEWKKLLKYL
ncbi:MAG: DNA-deoxyinosine glycosylase [Bergeyella sp.]|nr:DNA-deoxyinosine glycosylase [Bergeyella sp.]